MVGNVFMSNAKTYRVLRRDIEQAIRSKYNLERGTIAAVRWRKPKKSNEFSEWRVQFYRNEKSRFIGLLVKILKELTIKSELD